MSAVTQTRTDGKRASGVATMARKPAAVEQKEKDLIAWYKWEFLRGMLNTVKTTRFFQTNSARGFLEHGAWCDRRIRYDAEARLFFEETIAPKAKEFL